jgi:hypothetical protein
VDCRGRIADWRIADWLIADCLISDWLIADWLIADWLIVDWLIAEWDVDRGLKIVDVFPTAAQRPTRNAISSWAVPVGVFAVSCSK